MKVNDRVITEYRPGTIVKTEGEIGILSHCFCVALDGFNLVPDYIGADDIKNMQEKNGGIYFLDKKLTKID